MKNIIGHYLNMLSRPAQHDNGTRTIIAYWVNVDGKRVSKNVRWKIKYKKDFKFSYRFADTYLHCCDYCLSRNIGGLTIGQ